jgi:hypothetical protein
MYLCIKESERSCICVLEVMYLCVRGHVFVCQRLCICVLEVMYLCVRGHVFVFPGYLKAHRNRFIIIHNNEN